jgi:hypothetical protein
MTKETYVKGMLLFVATFQKMKIDDNTQDAWYMLLEDLSDEQYLMAIKRVCQGQAEFYPGTNIVALIREHARRLVRCRCGEVVVIEEEWKVCPGCSLVYVLDNCDMPQAKDIIIIGDGTRKRLLN